MRLSGCSSIRPWFLFATTLSALLVTFEGVGQGSDKTIERAKAHFRKGAAKYHQGRYEDALQEFDKSYQLSKRAVLLFNMAQCYERLGDLKRAIAFRKKYLSALPDAPNRTEVQAQIHALEARLAATAIRLVGKAPAGSVFMIDGRQVNPDPKGVIRTSPGNHELLVLRKGRTLLRAVVALAQGQQLRLPLDIRRSKRPAAHGTRTGSSRHMAVWITLGAAGAVLAGATGLAAAALATTDNANDALDKGYLTTYKNLKSKAKNLALGADISFAVSGGLAIAGLVLYLLDRHKPSEARHRARLRPMVGPGTLGVTTSWSFQGL